MTKKQKIAYYVLLVIISALFLWAAYMKFTENPQEVAGFVTAGLPLWFMQMIGIGEVLGVIGLWTDRFFRYGYEGLGLVLVGAFITTWMFVSIPFAFTIIIPAAILATIVWLQGKKAEAA